MTLNLYPLPIDAIAWCIGAAVLWIYSLKSYLNYRVTKNPLVPMYLGIGIPLGAACLLFGLPLLLTNNTEVLFYTNFIGDVCVQITMLSQAWLAWFVGWRRFIPLWVILLITAGISVPLLIIEYQTSAVSVSTSPYLLVYTDPSIVLWLKSLLYVLIAWPIGYFFIRHGISENSTRARTKSIATGVTFILISGAAVVINIFNHGSATFSNAVQNFVIFSIFLIITLWPHQKSQPIRIPNQSADKPVFKY